jgi:hypothetical protein
MGPKAWSAYRGGREWVPFCESYRCGREVQVERADRGRGTTVQVYLPYTRLDKVILVFRIVMSAHES